MIPEVVGITLHWVHDDGGRAAAGYKGSAGDCGVRALAIATGQEYQWAYDRLREGIAWHLGRRLRRKTRRVLSGSTSPRDGCPRDVMRKVMADLGWVWHPTMTLGSGCKVHVRREELPGGRLLLSLSGHYSVMLDGVIHDTYDPSREGTRCVYGFWSRSDQRPWPPR